MASAIEERRTSEAAAWGTFCHSVAEECLTQDLKPESFLGKQDVVDGFSFTFDEEMAECVQAYLDIVDEAAEGNELKIEQRFTLATLNPPFDAGGTADAVVYNAKTRNMKVIDLKTGRGVIVKAKGNPQLRTYALGALLANPQWDVDTVTTVIVQPRAARNDPVDEETISTAELLGWTVELFEGMHAAAKPDAPLVPGDHCRAYFCPAQATCPALARTAMAAARVWFDDLDQPTIRNTPDSLMPEDIAAILDMADLIKDWLNAVAAYGRAQAESGVAIPGYALVEKIGNRVWKDEKALIAVLREAGAANDVIFQPPKVRSPAQVEKLIGAKRKHLIADLTEKPVTGVNFVRADKTTRQPITPAVKKFFQPLGE